MQGSSIKASRKIISIFLLFSLGYVFLLFDNDVGFHVQLNLFY